MFGKYTRFKAVLFFFFLTEDSSLELNHQHEASDAENSSNWNIRHDNSDEDNFIPSDNTMNTSGSGDYQCNEEQLSFHHLAKNYLIKIKESNRLSNRATQNIACVTSALLGEACLQIEDKIKTSLEDANLNYEDIPGITEAFDNFANPFQGLGEISTDCLNKEPNFVVSIFLPSVY